MSDPEFEQLFEFENKKLEISTAGIRHGNDASLRIEIQHSLDAVLAAPETEVDDRLEATLDSLFTKIEGTAIRFEFLQMLMLSILSAPQKIEPLSMVLTDVEVAGDVAHGWFASETSSERIPVTFRNKDGRWKIHRIGTTSELLHDYRRAQEIEEAVSPTAVMNSFSRAMASKQYDKALSLMTEDAANEWIGEMMIPPVDDQNRVNNESRWTFAGSAPNLFDGAESLLPSGPVLSGLAATAAERRAACISLARNPNVQELLLPKLLLNRSENKNLPLHFTCTLSELRPSDAPTGQRAIWTWTSPENLPPSEVEFLQSDGLWKLNTIIDPALKPWPLPAEETAPPAESVPVDGATGVP